MGVDFVEIDVHETRDGELIVFHDYRLNRMCGVAWAGTGQDAGRDQAIASAGADVAEVLRVCRGRARVFMEIKRADPRKVAALITKLRMEREVIVFSLSVPRMKAFADAAPRVIRFGLIARQLRLSLSRFPLHVPS